MLDVSAMLTGDEIASRIEARMIERGFNPRSLADKADLNPTGVRDIITRKVRDPKYDTLSRIAYALDISVYELLEEGDAPLPSRVELGDAPPPKSRLVPVYDISASAGDGALVDYEGITHSLAFPPDYLRSITSSNPSNLTIISVKGDSMVPTLNDDDIVMLDMSKTSLGYEGLFVIRIFDVLHVKRLSHSRPGFVEVISDNREKYPPREYPLSDVEVVGKVLWSGGKV